MRLIKLKYTKSRPRLAHLSSLQGFTTTQAIGMTPKSLSQRVLWTQIGTATHLFHFHRAHELVLDEGELQVLFLCWWALTPVATRFAEATVVAVLAKLLSKYSVSIDETRFKSIPGESMLDRRQRLINPTTRLTLTPAALPLLFTPRS